MSIDDLLSRSRGRRLALLEAVIALAIARVLVVAVPLRRINPRLGVADTESPEDTASAGDAALIGPAIRSAARRLPWRCRCLEQAYAAKMMLRRRRLSNTLYLGVRKVDGEMEAHAWVRVGPRPITGGAGTGYTVVAKYADLM